MFFDIVKVAWPSAHQTNFVNHAENCDEDDHDDKYDELFFSCDVMSNG